MIFYLWKILSEDCSCQFGVLTNSIESARELLIKEITDKNRPHCVLCLTPGLDARDCDEMEDNIEAGMRNYKELLIDFIKSTHPRICEENNILIG